MRVWRLWMAAVVAAVFLGVLAWAKTSKKKNMQPLKVSKEVDEQTRLLAEKQARVEKNKEDKAERMRELEADMHRKAIADDETRQRAETKAALARFDPHTADRDSKCHVPRPLLLLLPSTDAPPLEVTPKETP